MRRRRRFGNRRRSFKRRGFGKRRFRRGGVRPSRIGIRL